MAENKYLRAMQQAKQATAPLVEDTAVAVAEAEPLTPAVTSSTPSLRKSVRSTGRPPGKRSNPDWEQVTLFVRKDTKRAALRRLMDDQSNLDLSEVIEQLLAKWAKAS